MHWARGRNRISRRALLRVLPLLGLALPSGAHAAGVGGAPQLSVRPGATCLEREALLQQLGRWLGEEPYRGPHEFVVEGSALDARTARLYVRLEGRTVAQRAFEPGPARCSELQAAVALALALAIKAAQQQELGERQLDAEQERAAGWAVSAAGLTSFQLLPELAPGLELAVRHELGQHFSLRLGALGVAALGNELAQQGWGYDASLTVLRADGCGSAPLARALRGGLCGGVWGGALYAVGTRESGSRSSVVSWFALASSAELELELSERWSLGLALALAVPLHDVRVGITAADGSPVAGELLPSVAWTASLGPSYKF